MFRNALKQALVPTRAAFAQNKIALLHSGNTRSRQLEVERKFLVTPASIEYMRSESFISKLKSYKHLGHRTTHDTYYDRNGFLFGKGCYIRRRNGSWEAKIRTGGDFINSSFLEVSGLEAVIEAIKHVLVIPGKGDGITKMLSPCAEFVTERESWMLDGKFQVDVDATDFGHAVGEVEMTRLLDFEQHQIAADEQVRREMDAEIRGFMESHPRAFPAGTPKGKLSAYFEHKNSSHKRYLISET